MNNIVMGNRYYGSDKCKKSGGFIELSPHSHGLKRIFIDKKTDVIYLDFIPTCCKNKKEIMITDSFCRYVIKKSSEVDHSGFNWR